MASAHIQLQPLLPLTQAYCKCGWQSYSWFKYSDHYLVPYVSECWRCKQQILLSACRRDSAVIKEEIKSFLANRRISQAVVAQVTGEYQLHQPTQPGPLNHHQKELASQQAPRLLPIQILLCSFSCRDQPESDFPLAPAARIRPERAEETSLLSLVPAGEDQPW